jgi:hypothetical protein
VAYLAIDFAYKSQVGQKSSLNNRLNDAISIDKEDLPIVVIERLDDGRSIYKIYGQAWSTMRIKLCLDANVAFASASLYFICHKKDSIEAVPLGEQPPFYYSLSLAAIRD